MLNELTHNLILRHKACQSKQSFEHLASWNFEDIFSKHDGHFIHLIVLFNRPNIFACFAIVKIMSLKMNAPPQWEDWISEGVFYSTVKKKMFYKYWCFNSSYQCVKIIFHDNCVLGVLPSMSIEWWSHNSWSVLSIYSRITKFWTSKVNESWFEKLGSSRNPR